jgi:hypothetical protein
VEEEAVIALKALIRMPHLPLSAKQIVKVRKWVADDWEAADMPSDLLDLVRRLLATVEEKETTIKLMRGEVG